MKKFVIIAILMVLCGVLFAQEHPVALNVQFSHALDKDEKVAWPVKVCIDTWSYFNYQRLFRDFYEKPSPENAVPETYDFLPVISGKRAFGVSKKDSLFLSPALWKSYDPKTEYPLPQSLWDFRKGALLENFWNSDWVIYEYSRAYGWDCRKFSKYKSRGNVYSYVFYESDGSPAFMIQSIPFNSYKARGGMAIPRENASQIMIDGRLVKIHPGLGILNFLAQFYTLPMEWLAEFQYDGSRMASHPWGLSLPYKVGHPGANAIVSKAYSPVIQSVIVVFADAATYPIPSMDFDVWQQFYGSPFPMYVIYVF
jgi:hypothetical protein